MDLRIAYPAAAAMAFTATPSFAEWAAVSVNKNTGHFGYSFRIKTKGAAKARAGSQCQKASSGADGCELELFTKNCFAVSYAGANVYAADGATKARAAKEAEASCQSNHGAQCVTAREHQHCASR